MRDTNRIPTICNELSQIWELHPDLRLGQLLLNVARDPELYYLEDDELIRRLYELYCQD